MNMNKSNTILYRHGTKLYLNITNRCPCRCTFCLRNDGEGINEDESLWLEHEPDCGELKDALDNIGLEQFDEAVFCGYGEPTERLEVIIEIGRYIKEKAGIPIRLNTNGLSDLVNGKKTAALLALVIDTISISLNAPTAEEYNELCHPSFGICSFEAMLEFAGDCRDCIENVVFTIVDLLPKDKAAQCREICNRMGIQLRVREVI